MGMPQMTDNLDSTSSSARKRNGRIAAAAVAVAALSFGAGGFVFSQGSAGGDQTTSSTAYSVVRLPAEGFREIAAVTRQAVTPPPRMLEQGSPFSFADLVEHVSPAVVTVVVDRESARGGGNSGDGGNLDDIPAPFRDFFRQFGGQGQGGQGGGQGRNRPQT